MEKKSIGLSKKGVAMEPPANLFEQEEAIIAGEDIVLQFEFKGRPFYSWKVAAALSLHN